MQILKQQTDIAKLIRERRSIKKGYNNKLVEEQTVINLLEDAIWAPNHGMRQPWRFIFVGDKQKRQFAKQIASTYPKERQANRENYLNEPSAILVVIMEKGENQKKQDENFGATACLIQNFQLLAWEEELGVVWKTNPHIYDPQVEELLQVSDNERIIGFLHMGYFDEKPEKKDRIPVEDKFKTFYIS
ncbi:nitroreductase family protein [Ornithinibacillus halotolerans]|uniref:Putative NAD(P)H nitroreductase n=1 Tax=Ornithinibacillus halotolerans TaxID=1274357 RepID=A0A916S5C6_9BACI|nr:nitroreductase [Ornithinibacillus halotolerans]GGA84917.1 putative NAD(P)H nitroreductase YfhC [Ornithinibacillus halotolerans]